MSEAGEIGEFIAKISDWDRIRSSLFSNGQFSEKFKRD